MRIFLLDDSNTLGRYISKAIPASEECGLYCVSQEYYGIEGSVDQFFHALLTEEAWRKDGDMRGVSLNSLMGNASEKCLFLIHINLKPTKTSFRQNQDGIELLKHIRLTEELGEDRNTHVVLYSFEEQLQLLKRKPGNLILLSEGVTFFRLPEGLENMVNLEKLANLANKQAHVEWLDFKRFVQCDYQPPDSAHQFSNWWGVRQIALARCADIPEVVVQKLRLLENKKTRFLFDHGSLHICDNPFPTLTSGTFHIIHIRVVSDANLMYFMIFYGSTTRRRAQRRNPRGYPGGF